MVSIETYRARIGMFSAGSSKAGAGQSFESSWMETGILQPDYVLSLKISRKFVWFLLVLVLLLVSAETQNNTEHIQCASSNPFLIHESFHKCDSILKASVLATKLIIGNVESNPGPMDFKEFLAFLFEDAEDVSVKEVLKEVKAAQDKQTNLKKIKSKSVDDLKATLAYLNDWDKDDENIKSEIDSYTKDGIALILIKKIYNMAPMKCSSCMKTSHFKPGEYCALSCIRCNRSACISCYESDREKLSSTCMFNKSLYFSCEMCTNIISKENHVEESYKKKSYGRKKSQSVEKTISDPT